MLENFLTKFLIELRLIKMFVISLDLMFSWGENLVFKEYVNISHLVWGVIRAPGKKWWGRNYNTFWWKSKWFLHFEYFTCWWVSCQYHGVELSRTQHSSLRESLELTDSSDRPGPALLAVYSTPLYTTVQPAGPGCSKYRMLTRVSQQGTPLLWSHGETFVSLSYSTILSVLNTFARIITTDDEGHPNKDITQI